MPQGRAALGKPLELAKIGGDDPRILQRQNVFHRGLIPQHGSVGACIFPFGHKEHRSLLPGLIENVVSQQPLQNNDDVVMVAACLDDVLPFWESFEARNRQQMNIIHWLENRVTAEDLLKQSKEPALWHWRARDGWLFV